MSYTAIQTEALRYVAKHGASPTRLGNKPVRSTTMAALKRRGAIREGEGGAWRITEHGRRHLQTIAENLDAPRTNRMQSRFYWRPLSPTFDGGQADYLYWDRVRRGAAEGLQIAGLLLKPIASKKAAWVLGDLPQAQIEDETRIDGMTLSEHVERWLHRNHATIMLAKEESSILGDMFLAVNPDESLVTIAPNLVEALVNERDYSELVGWRVFQMYEHPTEWGLTQEIVDEFTARWRRRWVGSSGAATTYRYNLPSVPVIHIPNNLRANERFGHSDGEALIHALFDYNAMFDSSADGVIRMGRPMIALEALGDSNNVAEVEARYGTSTTQTLDDGTVETTTHISLSSDDVLLLGGTGRANLLSPGSFVGDAEKMLGLIFYLFVQHTELPEFILGTAIASSKASADSQMPAFTRWMEKEQRHDEKWLRQLIRAYVAILTFTRLGRAIDVDKSLRLKWLPLTNQDGTLTLAAIDKAIRLGVRAEYLVSHLPLDMDDQIADIKADLVRQREAAEEFASGINEPFVSPPANPVPEAARAKSANSLLEAVQPQPGYVYVDLANEPELVRVQQTLLSALPASVQAEDSENLHITMVYAMNIGDKQFEQAAIEPFEPFKVWIIGVGMFNNPDSRALHLIVEHNTALDTLQKSVYDSMTSYVPKSAYSNPENWQPHITMAYLPKGVAVPSIDFEPFEIEVTRVIYARDDYKTAFIVRAQRQKESELV